MTTITSNDGILSRARKLEAMVDKGANDEKMRPLWMNLAERITNDVEAHATTALYHLRRAADLMRMEPEGVDEEVWKHLNVAAGAATCLNNDLFKYGQDKGEVPHTISVKLDVVDDEKRRFAHGHEPGDVRV